jgi:hypothetical protein
MVNIEKTEKPHKRKIKTSKIMEDYENLAEIATDLIFNNVTILTEKEN